MISERECLWLSGSVLWVAVWDCQWNIVKRIMKQTSTDLHKLKDLALAKLRVHSPVQRVGHLLYNVTVSVVFDGPEPSSTRLSVRLACSWPALQLQSQVRNLDTTTTLRHGPPSGQTLPLPRAPGPSLNYRTRPSIVLHFYHSLCVSTPSPAESFPSPQEHRYGTLGTSKILAASTGRPRKASARQRYFAPFATWAQVQARGRDCHTISLPRGARKKGGQSVKVCSTRA